MHVWFHANAILVVHYDAEVKIFASEVRSDPHFF